MTDLFGLFFSGRTEYNHSHENKENHLRRSGDV